MTLINYLRQFLRDVRSQKLRTFLTVFGIIWGMTAVTLLLAFGEGLHEQVMISQKGLGDNIIIAWPSRTSKPWEGLPRGRRIRLTEADMDLLRQDVSEVTAVSGEFADGNKKFKAGRNIVTPHMVGADPAFAVMRNLIPDAGGRYLNDLDMQRRRRVVFLGNELKEDLFGEEDAIGKRVRISGVPFTIIGIMQAKEQDSSYQGRDKDNASIPASTFRTMFGRRYVDNFVFQAPSSSEADAEAAKQKVIEIMARKYRFDPEDSQAIVMWDTTEGVRFLDAFFLAFRAFLGIVGALTLVVGGIGVSNIMNVVVEERTREIGIKMALGARRRFIIGQFLFETLLITLAGGAIGFGISWGLCAIFPSFQLEEFVGNPEISTTVALSTMAILGSIGFLAGFFPARTAANLRPVIAMKM